MSNNLMIFEGKDVEVFEFNGQVLFNPKHISEILDIKNINDNLRKMNNNQVIKLTNSKIGIADFRKLHNTGENFLTESGVYKLVFKSRKPEAERFSDWVTDEVLPTIRKTGGYINNSDLMVNTYFSDISDDQKGIVKGLLTNIEVQQRKIIILTNENDLLAHKNLQWADRPLINALVRAYAYSLGNNFGKAWNDFKKELLYKHSINLNARITNYLNTSGKKTKPKTLEMLDDCEIPFAISTIVSMCREQEIDIDEFLANKIS